MLERYIGVENELSVYNMEDRSDDFKDNKFSFFIIPPFFSNFKNNLGNRFIQSDTKTAIRTKTGNGFYLDGSLLELVTPPVAINEGFASNLTAQIILGRNEIIEKTEDVIFTGHSMHWNLSFNNQISMDKLYESIAIPFQLFSLSPLSPRFSLRNKKNRYELLGDSIKDKYQINATALLLASSLCALEEEKSCPIELPNNIFSTGFHTNIFIPKGRYDYVEVKIPSQNFTGKIQVQEYMELFHHWIEPYLQVLGTDKEISNLKAFIYGSNQLEFDKFKYFDYLKKQNSCRVRYYSPLDTGDKNNPGQILEIDRDIRKIPLEGQLLGHLTKSPGKVDFLSWNKLKYGNGEICGKIDEIKGIANMYEYISSLDQTLPDFIRSYDANNPILKPINKPDPNRINIVYDPNKDIFNPKPKVNSKPSKNNVNILETV